jgi:hypothetical protein
MNVDLHITVADRKDLAQSFRALADVIEDSPGAFRNEMDCMPFVVGVNDPETGKIIGTLQVSAGPHAR